MSLNRKINFFIVALFALIPAFPFAQDIKPNISVGGIYMNSQDYAVGRLSYPFDCKTPGKIKLNDFFSRKYIYVTVAGKRNKLNKDSIFGYRNCKNETFRFYNKHDEEFQIVENKGVVLYLSYIRVSYNNGKTSKLEPEYFFSKTIDSEILPLTLLNLKQAFPCNRKFHDMLDIEFENNKPLSAYSTTGEMYKINFLFNKSNQK